MRSLTRCSSDGGGALKSSADGITGSGRQSDVHRVRAFEEGQFDARAKCVRVLKRAEDNEDVNTTKGFGMI